MKVKAIRIEMNRVLESCFAGVMELREWLRCCDASGALDSYLAKLSQSFRSLEELQRSYLRDSKLAPEFFEDFDICDLRHQKAFRRNLEAVYSRPRGSEEARGAAGSASKPRTGALSAWLESLGVSKACGALQDHFDDPEQVFLAYTVDLGGNLEFDRSFFQEVGITKAEERIFERWFREKIESSESRRLRGQR